MSQPLHTVVAAQWCGYSQKQHDALGCTTADDNSVTCLAKTAGDQPQPIDFVWCQDKDGQAINQDNPACGVPTTGYPSWVKEEGDSFAPSDIKGFVEPCQLKDQYPGVLSDSMDCSAMDGARATCAGLQEEAKADQTVLEKVEVMKAAQADLQSYVNTNYESKCNSAMEEAQGKMFA